MNEGKFVRLSLRREYSVTQSRGDKRRKFTNSPSPFINTPAAYCLPPTPPLSGFVKALGRVYSASART